jgi:hypothetical protein
MPKRVEVRVSTRFSGARSRMIRIDEDDDGERQEEVGRDAVALSVQGPG